MTRTFIGTAILAAIVTAASLWSLNAWVEQWMASDLGARAVVLSPWFAGLIFIGMTVAAIGAAVLCFAGRGRK